MSQPEQDGGRAAEAALHARNAFIIESVLDGFVAIDRDWRYTYVNARGAELVGRRPEELIGRHIWTEFPDAVGRPAHEAFERAMHERIPVRLRAHYPPWDRWFENRVYPTDEGIAVLYSDITDQVKAELALAQSEQRLRDILDSMFTFVGLLTTDGVIQEVNRAPLQAAGLRREDVVGLPVWDTYWLSHSSAAQDRCREAVTRARAGETVRYEEQIRVGTGLLDIDLVFGPLRDRTGNVTSLVASAVDVSERAAASRALISSEDRYRRIVETATEGIWTIDADRRTTFVNPRMAQLLDYAADDMMGESILDFVEPELRSHVEDAVLPRSPHPPGQHDVRFRRRDGSTLWALVGSAPIHDSGGVYEGALVMLTDITARKLEEEELRHSREELRRLTAEIERARESERTRVAREIHDELGQALTGLGMDLAWIEQRMPSSDPDVLMRRRGARTLLAQTVGTVRRIAAELRPGVLDDLGLPAAIRWQAREVAERTGLRVQVEGVDVLQDFVDERATAVFRILQEALTNVVRHARANAVRISVRVHDDICEIRVLDDGAGFGPAERVERRRLGILGMRERAVTLGGALSVDQDSGSGTVVTLTLPAS